METERMVVRKQIGNHLYRLTVIVDNDKKYKIITIYGGHKITVPHKLMELMDQRYESIKELGKKLRSIESKLTKR